MHAKRLIAVAILALIALSSVAAHAGTGDVYVRVVSADPATRTYAFACDADPATSTIRDWFIRPDDGIEGDDPEEAIFLDRPATEHITHTFGTDGFYHVACLIAEPGELLRGDLHIDMRPNNTWNPTISHVSSDGLALTLRCDPASGATPSWSVLDPETGVTTDLGTEREITYTASGHGLLDFFCTADGNTVPLPVEFFDDGDPYVPDAQGIPDGVTNTWVRDAHPNPPNGTNGTGDGNLTNTSAFGLARVDADGGLGAEFICNPEGHSGDIVVDWNFGDGASLFDVGPQVTRTYATNGSYQVQCDAWDNAQARLHSLSRIFVIDSDAGGGNGTGNSTGGSGNTNGNDTCHSGVATVPATCEGGAITQDTGDGNCRTVVCTSGTDSLTTLACDKPDQGPREHFEMYKQLQIGSTPLRVCIGDTCIQQNGYAQSQGFPICTGNATNSTNNGTGGGTGTNTTDPLPTQLCTSDLDALPASCSEGALVQDSFNGCRMLSCADDGDNSVSVLACDKPDQGAQEYFEMYKQASTGTSLTLCIGPTCIAENGFARSPDYPVCYNSTDTTNTTNGTGGSSSGFPAPLWFSPSDGLTGVAPDFFHLELNPPTTGPVPASTDFEVWNGEMTQRVWSAEGKTGAFTYHVHTPDGLFEGPLAGETRLAFTTTYEARVRYTAANGTQSPWSEWRTFTTKAQDAGGNGTGTTLWSAAPGFRVELFATDLDLPVHVVAAPQQLYQAYPAAERPFLYVTELYGTIKVVYADGSQSTYASGLLNFDPFGSITGGGQMGLIGLLVDDTTGDLFAGMVYVENDTVKNKVVRFVTSDDGRSSTGQQTIIGDLPSAPSHQVEQITKGPDGKLYVNLGDALNPPNAQSDTVLAGRIIRMNMDGSGVETYAKGLRNPFGGDWRPGTGQLFVTDNAPDTDDRLVRVEQGGNYGWGLDDAMASFHANRIATLNVSPVDVEFNPGGAGFPSDLDGRLYVAVAGQIYQQGLTPGKQIVEFILDGPGNVVGRRDFVSYNGDGYGTPIGLDFAGDGLYFADIYGEPGFVGLGQTEGNIYRVVPGDPAGNGTGGTGQFRAGISVIPWYPKDAGTGIEYIFECNGIDGTGGYLRDWSFGDGAAINDYPQNRVGPHQYPYGNQEYTVACTVKDQGTGQSASASMVINPADFIAG